MCRTLFQPPPYRFTLHTYRGGVIHQGRTATPGPNFPLTHTIPIVLLIPDTIIFLRGSFHHRVTEPPPPPLTHSDVAKWGRRILFMSPFDSVSVINDCMPPKTTPFQILSPFYIYNY